MNIIKNIKIDGKVIGGNNPCYTIAEAGANHDGELSKAFKLIDAAKNAKADSVKFQTYKAEKLVTRNAPKYWDDGNSNETQFDVFNKLDSLKKTDWIEIFKYAERKRITCFSTPFDEESVDLLYSLGVPAFKIASADMTNLPLISYISKFKKPMIISTGMSMMDEIEKTVNFVKEKL